MERQTKKQHASPSLPRENSFICTAHMTDCCSSIGRTPSSGCNVTWMSSLMPKNWSVWLTSSSKPSHDPPLTLRDLPSEVRDFTSWCVRILPTSSWPAASSFKCANAEVHTSQKFAIPVMRHASNSANNFKWDWFARKIGKDFSKTLHLVQSLPPAIAPHKLHGQKNQSITWLKPQLSHSCRWFVASISPSWSINQS